MLRDRGLWAVLVVASLACDTRLEPTQAPGKRPYGFVGVTMIDAPIIDGHITAVIVCIERVEVIFNEDQPPGAIDVSRCVDLLELQGGVATLLGIGQFRAGRIQQIRLILSSASAVIDGVLQSVPVKVPSGAQTGLKLTFPGGFEIRENVTTTIILDFDAEKSLHSTDGEGWVLTPVVQLVEAAIVLAVTDPAPGSFVRQTWTVRGTAASKEPLASLRANGVNASISGTDWEAEVQFDQEGVTTLVVEALDVLGRSALVMFDVTVDLTPPTLTITAPLPGGLVVSGRQLLLQAFFSDALSGIDQSAFDLRIDGESVVAAIDIMSGTANALVDLADGLHQATATIRDVAGNESRASSSFMVADQVLADLHAANPEGLGFKLDGAEGLRYLGGEAISTSCMLLGESFAAATDLVRCFVEERQALFPMDDLGRALSLLEVTRVAEMQDGFLVITARQSFGPFPVAQSEIKLVWAVDGRLIQFSGRLLDTRLIPDFSAIYYVADPVVARTAAELQTGLELGDSIRSFDTERQAVVSEFQIPGSAGLWAVLDERFLQVVAIVDLSDALEEFLVPHSDYSTGQFLLPWAGSHTVSRVPMSVSQWFENDQWHCRASLDAGSDLDDGEPKVELEDHGIYTKTLAEDDCLGRVFSTAVPGDIEFTVTDAFKWMHELAVFANADFTAYAAWHNWHNYDVENLKVVVGDKGPVASYGPFEHEIHLRPSDVLLYAMAHEYGHYVHYNYERQGKGFYEDAVDEGFGRCPA